MSIITKTNDIGKYFLIIRSKKNTLFSSEYFFSFILLPLRYFFYLNQKGTLYNFKSKYQFPCFCVFFTLFFSGDVNIIVYIYLICIFVLIIRRKYHYYSMFGLSVFVVKV